MSKGQFLSKISEKWHETTETGAVVNIAAAAAGVFVCVDLFLLSQRRHSQLSSVPCWGLAPPSPLVPHTDPEKWQTTYKLCGNINIRGKCVTFLIEPFKKNGLKL